ncbi:hypothetical protein [Stenotrophomonas maltophilia]|uniref:hypothetical protein n=1 Tax=Stenotrophomonas maltophilia TaxID=40324 RepID=UPI002B1D9E50|nr:hypothetical protein [Stenotrophomonas maltophilia]
MKILEKSEAQRKSPGIAVLPGQHYRHRVAQRHCIDSGQPPQTRGWKTVAAVNATIMATACAASRTHDFIAAASGQLQCTDGKMARVLHAAASGRVALRPGTSET